MIEEEKEETLWMPSGFYTKRVELVKKDQYNTREMGCLADTEGSNVRVHVEGYRNIALGYNDAHARKAQNDQLKAWPRRIRERRH